MQRIWNFEQTFRRQFKKLYFFICAKIWFARLKLALILLPVSQEPKLITFMFFLLINRVKSTVIKSCSHCCIYSASGKTAISPTPTSSSPGWFAQNTRPAQVLSNNFAALGVQTQYTYISSDPRAVYCAGNKLTTCTDEFWSHTLWESEHQQQRAP